MFGINVKDLYFFEITYTLQRGKLELMLPKIDMLSCLSPVYCAALTVHKHIQSCNLAVEQINEVKDTRQMIKYKSYIMNL